MKNIQELSNLKGRTVILAGGAGHIGLAAAQTLMEMGAKVLILDKDSKKCEERVKELEALKYQGESLSLACDLENEEATRQAVQKGIKALGRLDILIHCAAYTGTTKMSGWSTDFDKQTVTAWDAALRVNMTSAFIMAQEARPALSSSKHGSLILFSSIYGIVGPDFRMYKGTSMGNSAGYNATKGGLIQLGRYLATLFAPDIRVNTISPGGVWRNQPEVFHSQYKNRTPLGRMASEEDLKGGIAFLASDMSAYVTGHNLVIDGGWTVW